MKLDAANINAIARGTCFQADNLEKLLRLRELITEFSSTLSFATNSF